MIASPLRIESADQPRTAAVEVLGLTKRYGRRTAIDAVTFDIAPGEVFGFLGPNGAGKTTTIRTLLGLTRPTAGVARILGQPAGPRGREIRAQVGYVPGSPALYPRLSAWDNLKFLARMRGVECDYEIFELADRLQLELHRHVHDLSHGNRQKVALIQALMHRPKFLLLDEPTIGLDPVVTRELEVLLRELTDDGCAVLLSSHILSEVEHWSDRVGIINQGRLLAVETIASLKARSVRTYDLYFDRPTPAQAIESVPGVSQVQAVDSHISCTVSGPQTQLLREAVDLGVIDLRTTEPSLEDIFFDLVAPDSARVSTTRSTP
ncbi:MAG: ABC transporter ATP-binding protein [Actinobacteria bacterium]|nr:ABC transporter ATP-binding protein [Actinomycetota bacterium]